MWQTFEVTVPRAGVSKLVFEARIVGIQTDMAIDDIQFVNCGGKGFIFLQHSTV